MFCLLRKSVVGIFGVLLLPCLSACGGGGSGAPGGSSGSGFPTDQSPLVGYSYSVEAGNSVSSPGNAIAQAILADGSGGKYITLTGVTGIDPQLPALATVGGSGYLFVPSAVSDNLTVFQTNGSSLVQVGGAIALSYSPQGNAIAVLSGPYLVLGDDLGNIHVYSVESGGILGVERTYATVSSSYAITGIAASPDNKYLMVEGTSANQSVEFSEFQIGSGGQLTLVGSTTLSPTNFNFSNLVADPSTTNGDYFYSGGTNGFYLISASASGPTATVLSTPTDGGGEWDFVGWIDPTGTWIYIDAWDAHTSAYTFDQFSIGPTGQTTYVGTEPNCNPANTAASFNGTYNASQGLVLFSVTRTPVCTFNAIGGDLNKPAVSPGAGGVEMGPAGIMVAS